MTKNIGFINAASQNWANLITLANTLSQVLSNEIVTANSAPGGGAMSAGNGFVTGIFGSNTLVCTTLQGGNVTTTSVVWLGANLNANTNTILSGNVVINNTIIECGANVGLNTTAHFSGNSTINSTVNSIGLFVGNTVVNSTVHNIGNTISNLVANSTALVIANSAFQILLGNSTVNAVINTTGFFFDGAGVGATGAPSPNTAISYSNAGSFAANGNFTFNWTTGQVTVGNSTVNVQTNSTQINIGGTNAVINTTTIQVGANALHNSTIFLVGNSTVNTFMNSSSHSVGPNVAMNSAGYFFNSGGSIVPVMPTIQTLTFNTTQTWNVAAGAIALLTLTANTSFSFPTSLTPGTYVLKLIQDTSGSRIVTWNNTQFKWAGKTAPVLTTTAQAVDVICFIYDGTNLDGSYMLNVG